MKEKIKLLVIFGGISSEHEVSCDSAASIIKRLDREKYDIYKIGITKGGRWILTDAETEKIADGTWENRISNRMAAVSPDRTLHGIRTLNGEEIHIDCVFPVLHGRFGEDGTMQGLLELAGIPYVGPGVLSSSCCMDKAVTKDLISREGFLQPRYYVTDRYEFSSDPEGILANIEKKIGEYPFFVKPANGGSSVGISKVKNQIGLFEGITAAAAEDHKIIIEEAISGRELEVAVLGNRDPKASAVGEILPANEFYDYEAKYINKKSRTRIATDLGSQTEEEIRSEAVSVYKTMNCRGMARVDFFLDEKNQIIFNEINTIPGFTNISMYPKLWEACGLSYEKLIDRLIELAMEE